jgi:diadenosine tetraphosphate (Ap4A) HIT family hydrolase
MHVHIIPRFNHEMMSGFPNRKQMHRAELDEIGRKIKVAIAAKDSTLLHSGRQ